VTQDQWFRLILIAQAGASVYLMGVFLGTLWPQRAWPTKVVIVGVLAVLVYLLAGQFKAFFLSYRWPGRVPFDAVAWGGVAAYTILLTGLVAFLVHNRRYPPARE
jgi:hypothetical protein